MVEDDGRSLWAGWSTTSISDCTYDCGHRRSDERSDYRATTRCRGTTAVGEDSPVMSFSSRQEFIPARSGKFLDQIWVHQSSRLLLACLHSVGPSYVWPLLCSGSITTSIPPPDKCWATFGSMWTPSTWSRKSKTLQNCLSHQAQMASWCERDGRVVVRICFSSFGQLAQAI